MTQPDSQIEVLEILRPGGRGLASIRLVRHAGGVAVLKDYSGNSTLFRRTAGALMARREAAAYRRLAEVDGVPRLIARRADGLLIEVVAARRLDDCRPEELTAELFDDVSLLLQRLRGRGVLHGDVKRNVLRSDTGQAVLVDFGASFVIRGWLAPWRPLLLRVASRYDARAVAKLKRRLAPHLLTPADHELLDATLPFEPVVKRSQRLLAAAARLVATRI